MRPVRLVVTAIGPYVGPLTLDFRLLGSNQLFLLDGPTGSGKTMLLDAMSFALFGETTGQWRNPKSLRSQHAPATLRTEVVFDFALGVEHYRIWRQPEQDRPRQRGSGTTTEKSKAILWRRTNLEDDAEAGQALQEGPADVTNKVVEILGFTADQFRNVTVLPQGEFQKFLNTKSEEREQILEVLFQTSRYRVIQETLKDREKEAKGIVEQQHIARRAVLQQAQVESEQQIVGRRAALEPEFAEQVEKVGKLRVAQKTAESSLSEAREIDRRLSERRAAEAAYDNLYREQPVFALKEAELADGRRAAPLQPVESEWKQREVESRNAAAELTRQREAVTSAEDAESQAQGKLRAEEAREGERAEAGRRVQFLQDLAQKVEQLESATATAKEAASKASRIGAQQAAAKQKLDACDSTLRKCNLELETIRPAANALEVLRSELAGLKRVGERRQQRRKAVAELEAAAQLAQRRTVDREARQSEYLGARQSVEDTEARWVEAQSLVLAQRLVEGAPCPVCGSLEHPSPASAHVEVPTERERKARRGALVTAESMRDGAFEAERQSGIQVATLTSQVAALDQELEAWASAPQLAYDQALGEKQLTFNAAEEAARRADELQRALETSSNAHEGLKLAFESADSDLRQAQLATEQCKAIAEERAGSVPQEFRDAACLNKALVEATTQAQRLKTALDVAQRRANEASQEASAARARVEFAAKTATASHDHAEAARSRFDVALGSARFRDEALYREAIRAPAQIAALDDEIRRYHGNLKAAEQRLQRARDQAEGAVQPDIPALEAAVTICQHDLEQALDQQRKIERDIQDCTKWLGQLSAIAADLGSAEKRYGIVSTLAHAASGGNEKRITLQRFVQVTLLERVLDSATVRLQAMSNGRYWLRVAQDMENRRSAAGLDLEVLDAHTGHARRVSTLSGGESFLASLSLALGLSDVVQSYAGGYHLESIFVDEGFGALDPEALDLALSTLRSLQHGGRLVGIISHVPELKQQIDVRLDVIAQKRGSTARFTVPGGGPLPEPLPVAD